MVLLAVLLLLLLAVVVAALLVLLGVLVRTSHNRTVPLPAVILPRIGSDVGWNVAAIMGKLLLLFVVVLLLLELVFVVVVDKVWILPQQLLSKLLLVLLLLLLVSPMVTGFQNRIVASEHPTANKEPVVFQLTLRA